MARQSNPNIPDFYATSYSNAAYPTLEHIYNRLTDHLPDYKRGQTAGYEIKEEEAGELAGITFLVIMPHRRYKGRRFDQASGLMRHAHDDNGALPLNQETAARISDYLDEQTELLLKTGGFVAIEAFQRSHRG